MIGISLRWVALAAALTIAAGALGAGVARAEHDAATAEQGRLEEAIHKYLLEHPDVVIEVLNILQTRRESAKVERTRTNIAAHREALVNDPSSPVAGNPEGDVTLVEFFDYQCTYCKRVIGSVMAVLEDDPGLRVVYKEFPILGPASVIAARAALASRKQDPGKYLAFHKALMASRGRLSESKVMAIAAEVGFDEARLKSDMALPEIQQTIDRNLALAEALGISGTPSFVIGDELVPGLISLDAMKKYIAKARAS